MNMQPACHTFLSESIDIVNGPKFAFANQPKQKKGITFLETFFNF